LTINPNNQLLLTKRLRIRILKEADLAALTPILSDPLVTKYLPFDHWESELDAQAWFQKTAARVKDGRAAQYIIERTEDNILIGTCLYFNYSAIDASADFGYVLGQSYWKQSYMLEAMTVFVRYTVTKLQLTSLTATVEKPNIASLQLLAKLGFENMGLVEEEGVELHRLRKRFSKDS